MGGHKIVKTKNTFEEGGQNIDGCVHEPAHGREKYFSWVSICPLPPPKEILLCKQQGYVLLHVL